MCACVESADTEERIHVLNVFSSGSQSETRGFRMWNSHLCFFLVSPTISEQETPADVKKTITPPPRVIQEYRRTGKRAPRVQEDRKEGLVRACRGETKTIVILFRETKSPTD